MRASQTVVVLIEVHHLETIELVRNLLNLLLLTRLDDLDALGIPADVLVLFNGTHLAVYNNAKYPSSILLTYQTIVKNQYINSLQQKVAKQSYSKTTGVVVNDHLHLLYADLHPSAHHQPA